MKPYTALEISSYYISKGVSPLKLQKLLYYAQSWFYVKYKKKLFNEKISGWIYGPVIYSVWDKFRIMKRTAIIPKTRKENVDLSIVEEHLNKIWEKYGHFSASELVDLSHQTIAWKHSRLGLLEHEPSRNEVQINTTTLNDFVLENGQIPEPKLNNYKGGSYSSILA